MESGEKVRISQHVFMGVCVWEHVCEYGCETWVVCEMSECVCVPACVCVCERERDRERETERDRERGRERERDFLYKEST